MMQCLILLMYLEEPASWDEYELKTAITDITDTVNAAFDITGIYSGGLYAGQWGEDAVVSFFVQHDDRYEEKTDQMIEDAFEKALELCGLEQDLWVMTRYERELLNDDEETQ